VLEKAIAITNQCDLQYKTAKNQRLHVELCLMQIASLDPEKKKDNPYIKPPESVAAPTTSTPKKTAQIHDSQTENPVAETTHVVKDRPQKDYKQPETEANSVVEEPSPTPNAEQPESLKVEEKKNAVDLNIKAEGVSGLSLSSISFQKKHKAKNSSDEPTTNRNSSVSQDELEKAWTLFVEKMEARGEYNLAALLKLDTPRLKSKTEIHLTFPNKTNKLELESSKTKVLTFLFDKLENDFLTFNINVDTEEEQKYVYTPKDKYEELVKANPLVDAMRKDFDLDL
jgi:DNA polymerase-3 subunit gamma/tau